MRICILETDVPADEMKKEHGDFADMFETWLFPALPEATWDRFAVHSGDNLPNADSFDGYMITGCRHGVYDDLSWMTPLAGFLRHLRDRHIPVGGVCFGHQIMAHAYGAQVEKSGDGWVLGADTYDNLAAFAIHQDQVQSIPTGVRHVTGSPRCRIGRIAYAFPALSVQYHPEFTASFMKSLLDHYGGTRIDKSLTEAAEQTLSHPTHVGDIARDFAKIFRCARPRDAEATQEE
ncbi:type 1 glutamine amidotransferase (plasmid) [Ruegeria sp. SCSIO 43209]|uniref:type 1 glutamine amidotransferase n=1 Tax=Ruegeria sp. SCSIO 43209 TaxID=2793010 RepID=UPI001CA8C2ED|nr:type 1 glutamine amidotransferase [Ruegeria sp. SCSIO 43209]UAB91085.1 type 1 glutamine amidotransferase [Ruegeria sp. SCSIO 43209]